MADAKDFAKELNALITRYIDGGCDPQTEGLLGAATASLPAVRSREMRRQLYEIWSAPVWLRRCSGPGDLHQSPHHPHRRT